MTTFTACALVRTYTETLQCHSWDEEEGCLVFEGEKTRTTEIGRIEFLPAGEWVYVIISGRHSGGTWAAYTREDARALYSAALKGEGWIGCKGAYTKAEATTEIVGSTDLPARKVSYSWGEGANRVAPVDLPAATCPVIRTRYRSTVRESALQGFSATFEGWTANHIYWTEISTRYV